MSNVLPLKPCEECAKMFEIEDLRRIPNGYEINHINLSSRLDREQYIGKVICNGCYCLMLKMEYDGAEWEYFPKVLNQV